LLSTPRFFLGFNVITKKIYFSRTSPSYSGLKEEQIFSSFFLFSEFAEVFEGVAVFFGEALGLQFAKQLLFF
jgi:hypothetical protein